MGLAEWFSTFCEELQVKDAGTISSRYKAITRRLNTDFLGHYVRYRSQHLCWLLRKKHGNPGVQ